MLSLYYFTYHFFPGIKESDTGLAPPALWDLAADKQTLQGEQPLQVKTIINQSQGSWNNEFKVKSNFRGFIFLLLLFTFGQHLIFPNIFCNVLCMALNYQARKLSW